MSNFVQEPPSEEQALLALWIAREHNFADSEHVSTYWYPDPLEKTVRLLELAGGITLVPEELGESLYVHDFGKDSGYDIEVIFINPLEWNDKLAARLPSSWTTFGGQGVLVAIGSEV